MGMGISKLVTERAAEFSSAGKELPYGMTGEDIYFHQAEPPCGSLEEPFYPPFPSDNELPELPIEIWQRIFAHLRRKIGPIKSKTRERGDYHQRDLVNAMRVCRKFYYLAAPILYARVVTDKPHLFLMGATKYSLARVNEYTRWTKLDLLQFVHRLDLMYNSTPTTRYDLRFPITKKDKAKFEKVIFKYEYKDCEEIRRMIQDVDNSQSAMRYIHWFRCLRRQYLKSRTPVMLSNLEIFTISHPSFKSIYQEWTGHTHVPVHSITAPNDNTNWPRYILMPDKLDRYNHAIDGKEPVLGTIRVVPKSAQFSYEFARLAAPKHVCMDDSSGPYAYKRYNGLYDKIKLPQPETITYHIYPRSVERFMLPAKPDEKALYRWRVEPYIFNGSTSRWVLDLDNWKNHSLPRQKADFFVWLRHNLYEFRKYQDSDEKYKKRWTCFAPSFKPEDKTKIEIYGVLNNIELIDDGLDLCASRGWMDYDKSWAYEQKIGQLYAFLDVVPGMGDIEFMEESAGLCPACKTSSDQTDNGISI
ncbi:uncharacterized protein I206_103587 [Kwoniella pini CBS 10737]|uniref:F-box domain-containing protein n=1 Tax=Kwoniella pini CBS 10737 TaxID=1296096 RepID=A0A1B9I9G8_9TREE|nr:uncharacterized protein I206_01409 [Kwoniella pini CBS 10737]OCF52124.1 hypothetical protein I206_01409 [Kwoniella pini CBS 10737]